MKRLLAFVALLAVGLVALKFAIGDDDAVRADTAQRKAREREAHRIINSFHAVLEEEVARFV